MRAGAGKLSIATVASVAPQLGIAVPEAHGRRHGRSTRRRLCPVRGRAVGRAGRRSSTRSSPGPGMSRRRSRPLAASCSKPASRSRSTRPCFTPCPPRRGARRRRPADPAAPFRRDGVAARLRRGAGRGRSAGCGRAAPSAMARSCSSRASQSHVVAPDGAAWKYRAAGPASASRAPATRSPGSSAACSPAAPSRSPRCSGAFGFTARPARPGQKVGPLGFFAREISGEVPGLARAAQPSLE